MAFASPRLDHVVLDVRDRMEEAVRTYRSLGFHLTDRSHHTLGSMNHLAIFDTDYLELLGMDPDARPVRAELAQFPLGMNGVVFSTEEPDALFEDLQASGVPADEPQSFSRPVQLPEGEREVKFRVVRLRPGTASFGRMYFCHHLTPQYVWRPEWHQHPNGAKAIAQVIISVRDPEASSEAFRKVFGPVIHLGTDGAYTLTAGAAEIVLLTPEMLRQRLGDAVPEPGGRDDYIAALSIRTDSLSQTVSSMASGGIKPIRVEPQRVLVPAAKAMNVALEFVQ